MRKKKHTKPKIKNKTTKNNGEIYDGQEKKITKK